MYNYLYFIVESTAIGSKGLSYSLELQQTYLHGVSMFLFSFMLLFCYASYAVFTYVCILNCTEPLKQ